MRVFEQGLEVIGANTRGSYANRFVKRRMRQIYLQIDPDNELKSDSLRVMSRSRGWFMKAEKCIGHVPLDTARKLLITGMVDKVKVRLQLICIEDNDSIIIRFDILGPVTDYEKYCS